MKKLRLALLGIVSIFCLNSCITSALIGTAVALCGENGCNDLGKDKKSGFGGIYVLKKENDLKAREYVKSLLLRPKEKLEIDKGVFVNVPKGFILKKYSNTRSSTFKLHVKEQNDIEKMENHIVEDFIKSINEYSQYLPDYNRRKKIDLKIGKSEDILYGMKSDSVDLIVTSPPYGDNSTTVTYGQYSMLPIYWIDRKDMESFDEKLIDNYSSIDSNSLGGRIRRTKQNYQSDCLNKYVESIATDKRNKVVNFITDYLDVMGQMGRIIKKNKRIVLTLGNRRVDNKTVPLSKVTQEYFESIGFELEASITRNIPIKRMPRRLSNVKDKSVESMNQEYVLILRKIKEV